FTIIKPVQSLIMWQTISRLFLLVLRLRARWPLPVAAFPFMSLIPSVTFTRLRAGYGAAVFLLFATSAFAQEQETPPARSVSPDGKWEFRAGAAGEQGDFVIAKTGSVETSLVLSEEEYTDGLAEALGRAPGYANIVWAPDSKRFAFNLQPAKAYQTTQFYQLDENTWRKLDSLESNAATLEPLERSMAKQKQKLKLPSDDEGWPIMNSWQVRKWIDSSTTLLYAHREKSFEIKNETQSVRASFFYTLKFDPAGYWKIASTREVVLAEAVGRLNENEQEEARRIGETQKKQADKPEWKQ